MYLWVFTTSSITIKVCVSLNSLHSMRWRCLVLLVVCISFMWCGVVVKCEKAYPNQPTDYIAIHIHSLTISSLECSALLCLIFPHSHRFIWSNFSPQTWYSHSPFTQAVSLSHVYFHDTQISSSSSMPAPKPSASYDCCGQFYVLIHFVFKFLKFFRKCFLHSSNRDFEFQIVDTHSRFEEMNQSIFGIFGICAMKISRNWNNFVIGRMHGEWICHVCGGGSMCDRINIHWRARERIDVTYESIFQPQNYKFRLFNSFLKNKPTTIWTWNIWNFFFLARTETINFNYASCLHDHEQSLDN